MYSRIGALLLGFALLHSPSAQSQTPETMPCNTDFIANPSTQRGGRYITAQGALNVLFVYVQFPDNNYAPTNANWPKGGAPSYLNQTVDQVWSPTPTSGGFTDYFNQMSFNALRITGRSDTITTPHTRAWYLQNSWQAGAIQRELLETLDVRMDFSDFDHWRFNSEYNLTNSADGVVDMILMMWRDIASDLPNWQDIQAALNLRPGGYASLGGGAVFFVDNGARRIQTGYYGIGSGVTNIFGHNSGLDAWTIWTIARHEFGHWLLGGNEYHTQLGTWGILNGFGTPSGCMNSFERERLAWMNFNTIDDIATTRTISNVTLPDFVSTGIAYRIKVPGGGSDEWYLLENHQRISTFDVPDNNVATATGLYVLHQSYGEGSGVGVVSAQGRFIWTVPYQLPNIYGSNPPNLPVFQRESVSRVNGYSKRQNVPWTWQGIPQGAAPIHYHLDYVTGVLHQAPPTIFTGDGQDQFDIDHNTVFTPASNPSTDIYGDANKVGFEITTMTNGICTMNIHINTSESASPSKPQDPQLSSNSGQYGNIRFSWAANQEPDLASYEVSRKVDLYGNVWEVMVSATTNTYWVDPEYLYAPPGGDFRPTYRVRAKDTQGLYSVYSDEVSVRAEQAGKIAVLDRGMPREFSLRQNFPNPFNPSTQIKYDLPVDGFVSVAVYDILGRKVADLVNEYREAGYHSATWNAANQASGVYIARFTVSNEFGRVQYAKVNKLVLMK